MATQRETFNNRPVYSLFEISKSLESVVSKTYTVPYYIKAEIIKLNYYPHSGHCYPELVEKENGKIKSQLRGVIWSAQFNKINERFQRITGESIKENVAVICLATVEYSARHGLALHIQDIEPVFTLGELLKNRRMVVDRLKKENIFHLNKERKLPLLVERIAIISVETSKGYSDFMVTLEKGTSFPFKTTLFPSILQGDHAVVSIINKLYEIEQQIDQFDCVILIRGGGGDVGMTCYDDYQLVHRIANFPIPVITGIGHSTNETVADMVAYSNKITPTEVAYFFIHKVNDYEEELKRMGKSITSSTLQIFKNESLRCEALQKTISYAAQNVLMNEKSNLKMLWHHIKTNSQKIIKDQEQQLDFIGAKIDLLKPENILKRGYSITMHKGRVLTDASQLKDGDEIVTQLYIGKTQSIVKK